MKYTVEGRSELDASPRNIDGTVYRVGDVYEKYGTIFIGTDKDNVAQWATPEEYETKVKPVLEQIRKELKEQKIKEGEGVDNRRATLAALGGTGGAIIGTGAGLGGCRRSILGGGQQPFTEVFL